MKVMVIVKASKDSEAGELPDERILTEMGKYNEELVKAGIMLSGEGLHPTSDGVRIRFSGKDRTVIDGPFTETKELIAGFWIWRVKSMEEAIEWVKKCPNPHNEESDIEIRQIFEADELGEGFTPELREQEAVIRAQTLGLIAPRFEDGGDKQIGGLNRSYTIKTKESIPKQWEQFAPSIGKVSGQVNNDSYGVCWDMNGESFNYLTGVEISDAKGLPADYTHVRLPASRYVIFTHRGHVSTIDKTFSTIWESWVPDCGLKIAKAPSFERYTDSFDPGTLTGDVEIWIPLESQA